MLSRWLHYRFPAVAADSTARVTAETLIRSNPSRSPCAIHGEYLFLSRRFAGTRSRAVRATSVAALFSRFILFDLLFVERADDARGDETIIGEVGNYRMTPLGVRSLPRLTRIRDVFACASKVTTGCVYTGCSRTAKSIFILTKFLSLIEDKSGLLFKTFIYILHSR